MRSKNIWHQYSQIDLMISKSRYQIIQMTGIHPILKIYFSQEYPKKLKLIFLVSIEGKTVAICGDPYGRIWFSLLLEHWGLLGRVWVSMINVLFLRWPLIWGLRWWGDYLLMFNLVKFLSTIRSIPRPPFPSLRTGHNKPLPAAFLLLNSFS